jgi:predicted ArsR family transcriptional regulator
MKPAPSSTRHDILRELKLRGSASQGELAEHAGISREAIRQQMAQLESLGWVKKETEAVLGRGRPAGRWALTAEGDEQFPRFYDALAVGLLRTVGERLGKEGLRDVLASMTDQQVSAWLPELEGKPLTKRIEALRGIYFDEDPFTRVGRDKEGAMLIEHNCPYLSVAMSEPRLCSLTVSTMKRLLGVEVERTERFQQGDGRCVFRIREDRPVSKQFRFGWED